MRLDAACRNSTDVTVREVASWAGGIDVLVNNAAVLDMAPALEATEQSSDRQFGVKVRGLLFTLQAITAQMIARPGR